MAIRTVKVEVFGFSKDRRDAWRDLAVSSQRITNRLWQIWLCHHANAGTANIMRKHLDAYREWERTKQGEKPKWPCKAIDAVLTDSKDSRSFYRVIKDEFPDVSSRTRGLITNAWQSKVGSGKSASGALPRWLSILFGMESVPSFTKPQPIPFDYQNSKLIKDGDEYVCELRIERIGDRQSVVERCELMLGKRKCGSVRATVEKIISGEYEWKGSSLKFDGGKWFVLLAYERPVAQRPELDRDKVMFVRPGKESPWRVMINDEKPFSVGRDRNNIEHTRRAFTKDRDRRKAHYLFAGSSAKGHGRRRATKVWTRISSEWKHFVKNFNRNTSRKILEIAIRNGCGRIVYLPPNDTQRNSRYLSKAGNDNMSDTSWDYFQFGTLLAGKCELEGVEYGRKEKSKVFNRGVRGVRKSVSPKRGSKVKSSPAGV